MRDSLGKEEWKIFHIADNGEGLDDMKTLKVIREGLYIYRLKLFIMKGAKRLPESKLRHHIWRLGTSGDHDL